VDAVHFIANIKGHKDVESVMKKLGLQPLEHRKQAQSSMMINLSEFELVVALVVVIKVVIMQ